MSSDLVPPPPNAPQSTPSLVLTPHMLKRRDGLCPSMLDLSTRKGSMSTLSNHGSVMTKSYRTASPFLHSLRPSRHSSSSSNGGSGSGSGSNSNSNNNNLQEGVELQALVKSITNTLDDLSTITTSTTTTDTTPSSSRYISSFTFEPVGCQWTCHFPSALGLGGRYNVQVVCLAAPAHIGMTYVIDAHLMGDGEGLGDAKTAFDYVALQIRKAVVKCEFPEFPEGCKGRPFREVYQLNARLKSGSFATVCRGTHRATGKKVAIKCVLRKDLPPADDAAIYDEVAILASLEHPYIVPLIDFFEEKDCYFLVMELMSGGDLFDRIGKKKSYSEADARDLVCKMLKAMSYCHSNKIAHCDMKPKNLLLISDENDSFIKLADFGFAARVYDPKSLTKQCGTPFFVSPEILLRHPYDQQSDMWSVGCIVYLLLSGNLPFMGRSQKDLFRKIVSGKYEFDEDWVDVSDDAKDLVSKLLVLDPDVRWTADKALRHPWLRASQDRLSMILLQRTSQRLKTFNARMKLRSAMIAVDWVSTLTRMSWSSKLAAAAMSGGALPVNPLLAAARKAAAQQEALEKGEAEAPAPPPVDKFAALTLEDDANENEIKEEAEGEEEK